tara:strand:- start:20006 stop:20536 length:531 start_codon:yes stop_codon:yes gene_type:complete
MTLDPLADLVLRGALALILVLAALHKLRDRATFEGQLGGYDLLPASLVHPASRAIPLSELAVALFLLARSEHASLCGVILFVAYGAAIAINLLRGRREIDCGCGGADGLQQLHPALVIRNLVLALGAAAISWPLDARALNWADYLIAVLAALTLVALYIGFNNAVAQVPASKRLKA